MSDLPLIMPQSRSTTNNSRQLFLTSIYALCVILTLLMVNVFITGDVILKPLGKTFEQEYNERNISQMPFQYQPPPAAGINQTKGILFTPDHNLIHRMGLPPKYFSMLTRETVRDFVFVTAADNSHFVESLDAIASVQHNCQGYHIHYYDLGLSQKNVAKLKKLCNVRYHNFDLSGYSPHIRRDKLHLKCWKFIIIQEALQNHGAIFWMDASFRATKNIAEWSEVFSIALETGGAVFGSVNIAPLTNFAYTDPRMFDYFPTDQGRQKETYTVQSGAMLLYNTRNTFNTFLWWMYLCSLQGDCCPPSNPGHRFKTFNESLDRYHEHRHDQSALNLLFSNYYGYDTSKYSTQTSYSVFVRGPSDFYTVQQCVYTADGSKQTH